jgi:1-acyl-sn-glycerol-3-phosphate acyltransferase
MSLSMVIQQIKPVQKISRYILRLIGWRTNVIRPEASSYVLIGAPHTSNWDFAIMMLLTTAEGIPIHWLGKDSLFRGPLGMVMRLLGAIPVNRNKQTNLVDQIAAKFNKQREMIIVMAPEGTRSKTSRWRSGFYYIALKAQVPIAMSYADYKNKVCGIVPGIKPTGDIKVDFEIIRNFYKEISGKYPDKQGAIELANN